MRFIGSTDRKRNNHKLSNGFALPTVLIASLVMLVVLLASVVSTAAVSVSLQAQYYNQLAKNGADAGIVYAKACLSANGGVPLWSDAHPLMPSTNCAGYQLVDFTCPTGSTDSRCYVAINGNVVSTFSVGLPTLVNGKANEVKSIGSTLLLKTSDGSVWRTYIQSSRLTIPALIPITAIGATSGSTAAGSVLTAGALTPSGATATYQWQSSTTANGIYTNIPGATSNTYTVAVGDVGNYIRVVATGTGLYSDSVTSVPVYIHSGLLTALSPATIATGTKPWGIAISADGNSVYVANTNSNTISMYSRNTTTGQLTVLSPATIATGTNPESITISIDGTSVYVTNFNSNTISMYSRNTTTGQLTALSPATIATGTFPNSITISADGTSVYVTNANSNTISMYSRNTTTGQLTALSPATIATGTGPNGITISADGTSVYVTSIDFFDPNTISMYSRNTTTGQLTALSPATIATGTFPSGITISTDGTSVYITDDDNTISMYSRNTTTGQLTALSPATIATGTGPYGITISADGTSVYVTNFNSNTISMYSRNTTTGQLTALSPATIATGTNPMYITISADGNSVYITNNGDNTISMYRRN